MGRDWPYRPRFSLLCFLFGHKSREGAHGGGEYMKVRRGAVDGLGVAHCTLLARCPRCDTQYVAGKIHLRENRHAG
jgi:hypothetical protein